MSHGWLAAGANIPKNASKLGVKGRLATRTGIELRVDGGLATRAGTDLRVDGGIATSAGTELRVDGGLATKVITKTMVPSCEWRGDLQVGRLQNYGSTCNWGGVATGPTTKVHGKIR